MELRAIVELEDLCMSIGRHHSSTQIEMVGADRVCMHPKLPLTISPGRSMYVYCVKYGSRCIRAVANIIREESRLGSCGHHSTELVIKHHWTHALFALHNYILP